MKTALKHNEIFSLQSFAEINISQPNTAISKDPFMLNNFSYQEYLLSDSDCSGKKRLKYFASESFYLIYCRSGSLTFNVNGKLRRLRSQECCIIYDRAGNGIVLDFNNTTLTRFYAIGFNRPEQHVAMRENTCFFKFKHVFNSTVSENRGYYKGKRNLEIFEKVNLLSKVSNNCMADEFMVEGIFFQIFGLKIIQMLEESENGKNDFGGFSCWEMEQLQMMSDHIATHPGKEYTVEYLCRKSGLGPNKLQKGFKRMHNRTIIDYIRNVRLEKSVELIKTTNMTISEIVYTLGLSSRSYFSKIFKGKYKCSPKKFQQLQKG